MRVNVISLINWHFIAHVTGFAEVMHGIFNMLPMDLLISRVKIYFCKICHAIYLPTSAFYDTITGISLNTVDFLK